MTTSTHILFGAPRADRVMLLATATAIVTIVTALASVVAS